MDNLDGGVGFVLGFVSFGLLVMDGGDLGRERGGGCMVWECDWDLKRTIFCPPGPVPFR